MDCHGMQPLQLIDEAVDFAHLIDTCLCLAFSLNDFFDFFSKRFHILWERGQITKCMRESLPRIFKEN